VLVPKSLLYIEIYGNFVFGDKLEKWPPKPSKENSELALYSLIFIVHDLGLLQQNANSKHICWARYIPRSDIHIHVHYLGTIFRNQSVRSSFTGKWCYGAPGTGMVGCTVLCPPSFLLNAGTASSRITGRTL